MRARVRGQHSPRHPAPVKIAWRALYEPANVMAPVSKARQAKRETAAKFSRHRRIRVLSITTPMQRVTLASGPRATSPNDVVAGHFLRHVRDRLVVTQRIQ